MANSIDWLDLADQERKRRQEEPMDSYKFREWEMRADMVEAVNLYVEQGIEPGGFLSAVICNNPSESVGRADLDNLRNLPAIVSYFYNECPSPCWGSRDKMNAWQKARQSDGPKIPNHYAE